jgi:hypothetical protein
MVQAYDRDRTYVCALRGRESGMIELWHRLATTAFAAMLLAAMGVHAADLPIYDESLENGFVDGYSYGGGTTTGSTLQAHIGTHSVEFIGNNYNAVSFTHPTSSFAISTYPTLHFWIRGGSSGSQQLELFVGSDRNNVTPPVHAPLNGFIAGGSISASQWREVTVPLAAPPLSAVGSVERIDLQSEAGGAAQAAVYIDDISLQGVVNDPIFANGFEGSDIPPAGNGLVETHDVATGTLVSDTFAWNDASGNPRLAVLAHNDGAAGPGGTRGGELREFRYQVAGNPRIVRASGNAFSGFGYFVSHPNSEDHCTAGHGDTSSLGHFRSGTWTRLFEGRHHAIFRFQSTYPRYCTTAAPAVEYDVPVTIDWVFSTGRDNPLWAMTVKLNDPLDATYPINAPVNALEDDSRGPYGELLFDGAATEGAHSFIAGVGWGDGYKFISGSPSPVTYNSAWTWNTPNTIPYVKLWTTTVDATMGTVATQTITEQDAGGYFGNDRWNTTSAAGNACAANKDGPSAHLMPCSFNFPYQSISYSMGEVVGGDNNVGTRNTRLAWGTNFGFLGQSAYHTAGTNYYGGPLPDHTAPGWPKKSYSNFVVLGLHSTDAVAAQVTQMEVMQSLSLSTTVGSVVSSGPAGINRTSHALPSDTISYTPAGYDPVYSALAFSAAGNALDANIGVGSGTLKHPLIVIGNTSVYPTTVKLGATTLVLDVDYFPSLRPAANELWITLNQDLSGATNHLQIVP